MVAFHIDKTSAAAGAAYVDLVSSPDSCGSNRLCFVDLGCEGLHGEAPVSLHGLLAHGGVTQGARQGAKAGHFGHAATRPSVHGDNPCNLPWGLTACMPSQ